MIPQSAFKNALYRREFATVSARSSLRNGPALPLLGLGIIGCAVIFAFAPSDTFDNLDCQSYCERVVNGEVPLNASSLSEALRQCTSKSDSTRKISASQKM